jgi:ketosteroid isomerase-like protein
VNEKEIVMSEQMGDQFAAKLQDLERTRDPGALIAMFSDDVELQRAAQTRQYRGLDGAREFWKEYLHMFRDVTTTFDAITQVDGRAALEWHSTCKLDNGTEVSYQGCTVIETDGKRVNKLRTYYDSAAVMGARAPGT